MDANQTKHIVPDIAAALREIADCYEAWKSSLSTLPAPPTDNERELRGFIEETFGPDPHPLATSLQNAVDSALVEKVCNWLLAKGLPDAAIKLERQHKAGIAWLKEPLPVTTSPVSDKSKPAVSLALIDIFIVQPMTSLCRDLADGIEAQHKALGEAPPDCSHTADFSSVTWYGERYEFNETQAKCVAALWPEWEKDPDGKAALHQKTIRYTLKSENADFRLIHVFRHGKKPHPAWGHMIHPLGHGKFCLGKPPAAGKQPSRKTTPRSRK
jgi:hypothetical protein